MVRSEIMPTIGPPVLPADVPSPPAPVVPSVLLELPFAPPTPVLEALMPAVVPALVEAVGVPDVALPADVLEVLLLGVEPLLLVAPDADPAAVEPSGSPPEHATAPPPTVIAKDKTAL